jgi:hypothetical protein
VAACGPRAATGASAADRCTHGRGCGRSGSTGPHRVPRANAVTSRSISPARTWCDQSNLKLWLSEWTDERCTHRLGHAEEDHYALAATECRQRLVDLLESREIVLPVVGEPDIGVPLRRKRGISRSIPILCLEPLGHFFGCFLCCFLFDLRFLSFLSHLVWSSNFGCSIVGRAVHLCVPKTSSALIS